MVGLSGPDNMPRRRAGARAQAQAAVRQHSISAGPAQDARHPQSPGLCAPAHRPAGSSHALSMPSAKQEAHLLTCAWQIAQCTTNFIGPCHNFAGKCPSLRPTRLMLSLPCPRTTCACLERGLRPARPCAGVPRLAAAHAAHPALARGGLGDVEGLQLLLRCAGHAHLPPH